VHAASDKSARALPSRYLHIPHPLSSRSPTPLAKAPVLLLPLPPTLPANFSNVSFLIPRAPRCHFESFCSPQVPPSPNLRPPFIHLFNARRCYHSERGPYFLVLFLAKVGIHEITGRPAFSLRKPLQLQHSAYHSRRLAPPNPFVTSESRHHRSIFRRPAL
jgi:hypothetical protein